MKIRVLQVCGQLSIGGQEMMVKNFFKYINKEKFEFDYIVYGDKIGEYEEELENLGCHIYHVTIPTKSNMLTFKEEVKKIIKEGNYTVVHSHTYTNNGIILKIAYDCKVPIRISHIHSTESGKNENIIYRFYKKTMKHLILKNATHLMACGKKAGNSFYGDEQFKNRGIVIKNGINVDDFKFNQIIANEIKKKYSLDNKIVIGHIGRFVSVKNHKYIIKIIENLSKEIDNFIMIFIGDGELKSLIENEVVKKRLSNKVLFFGKRNDIDKLLQAIDIVLCPSLYEGLPVSLIEAQTSGAKCLVSTNVSKEVEITNNVSFIDIEDLSISEWCKQIKNFHRYDRTEVFKIIEKKGYNIKKSCEFLEKIYESK